MAVGSGLSATLGFAQETTPGVPVVVTRFVEFDSESLNVKKRTVQGVGLRGGSLTRRGSRRLVVSRDVQGAVNFDAPSSSLGLILQQMMGSFATTATALGGGLFQQIHNVGSVAGKSFTTQVVRPDITGVLAQNAYTYTGCKVVDWTLSAQFNTLVKLSLTIDAQDLVTPSNNFAGTTLAASVTAGAVSISTAATIAAGSYILIGAGLTSEVLLTGTVTGAGPYAVQIVGTAVAYAHASGVAVSSATGVNAGAAAALQAASYTAGTGLFAYDYAGSQLVAGGVTSVVSGVWTNTGGTVVGNVRTVNIKATRPVKNDRYGLGSAIKSEQIENDYMTFVAAFDIEYASPYFTQNYLADVPLCVVLKFTSPVTGGYLQIFAPVGFQDDGAEPNVAGPDILIPKLNLAVLDDGVNGAMQVVYVSTDAAV